MFSNASSPFVNQNINSTNYGNKMVKIDLTKNVLYPNNKNINSKGEEAFENTSIHLASDCSPSEQMLPKMKQMKN